MIEFDGKILGTDMEGIKKRLEEKRMAEERKLKKMDPEEIADDFNNESFYLELKEEDKLPDNFAVNIISKQNERLEEDLELIKESLKTEKEEMVLNIIGEDNFYFILRLRAYHHIVPWNFRKTLEGAYYTKIFHYFDYNMENNKRAIEGFSNLTEEEIEKERDIIEKARKLIEDPLMALRQEEERKKIKQAKEKTEEDVESDVDPESILWHLDRRAQGIKKGSKKK